VNVFCLSWRMKKAKKMWWASIKLNSRGSKKKIISIIMMVMTLTVVWRIIKIYVLTAEASPLFFVEWLASHSTEASSPSTQVPWTRRKFMTNLTSISVQWNCASQFSFMKFSQWFRNNFYNIDSVAEFCSRDSRWLANARSLLLAQKNCQDVEKFYAMFGQ
jgi:hypothetical protein